MADELAQPNPRADHIIAPAWHTLLLVVAVLAVSILGLRMRSHSAALANHHVREYLETLVWEWALAAGVLWGLSLRRTPLRTLLGSWPTGGKAWLQDTKFALAFWAVSALLLSLSGMLLKLAHLQLPQGTIAALAPANLGELLLFLALSLSAGFCEELLFRGYFEQQFLRMAHGRIWLGIAASALLFGCAHLYEGAAGVILITIFGVMLSFLAHNRGSLRPGMIAHAWHDALSGLVLFLLQHSRALS
jgi:membrane protease YdiL (CAAX protease family)